VAVPDYDNIIRGLLMAAFAFGWILAARSKYSRKR
jgi:hypothetical protein